MLDAHAAMTSHLTTMQGVSWATTSVLVIQLCDWLSCLPLEVECMWSTRGSSRIKVHYFLSRYVMLALHITHYASSLQMFMGSATLKFCIGVYVYRCAIIMVGAALVEAGLLLRVVALYHERRNILYILFCFHIICLLLQCIAQSKIMVQLTSAVVCSPPQAQRVDLVLLGLGVAISQTSFLGMTLYKLITENMLKKSELALMMFKEGICMFIALIVMLLSIALYENFRTTGTGIDLSEVIFVLFVLSLSLVAPRLTLHLRKMALKDPVYGEPDHSERVIPQVLPRKIRERTLNLGSRQGTGLFSMLS